MKICGSVFVGMTRVIAAMTCTAFAYGQMPAPGVVLRPQPGTPMQDESVDIGLHVVVVQGQNGINIVKKRAAVKPVIQVRDRTNMPVAGASVTFTAPNDDPSAVFLNGSRSETLVTDRTGEATVASMKPEGTGTFELRVTATFQGDTATTNITQTNVMTAADAARAGAHGEVASNSTTGMSHRTVLWIVAGAVVAAGAGAGVALANGKSSSTSTVGVGTPTVGAPH